MTFQEATEKVTGLAASHGGKLGNKVNFSFEEGNIHLDDTQSPATVTNDDPGAPCTLKMSLDTFEKLINGDVNPMMAFMTGKMKVEGDKGIAMKLSSLF